MFVFVSLLLWCLFYFLGRDGKRGGLFSQPVRNWQQPQSVVIDSTKNIVLRLLFCPPHPHPHPPTPMQRRVNFVTDSVDGLLYTKGSCRLPVICCIIQKPDAFGSPQNVRLQNVLSSHVTCWWQKAGLLTIEGRKWGLSRLRMLTGWPSLSLGVWRHVH